MNTLFEQVKPFCFSLGFNLVGVTTPGDLEYFSIYEKWIADSCHADMHYLAGEHALYQRKSPRNVMPSCQSILVLAFPYPSITIQSQRKETTLSSIAGYAYLQDYHAFLPPLLQKVVHFIQERSGLSVESKVFTDSEPLLERELGYQAGLGWIGKNSCLINKDFGSFFLLSEILLDIPLSAEQKNSQYPPDHCGTCQHCIENYPTHCIRENRTLDSRRCISYLTIENKGEIPLDLRTLIGDHLFGCDICQQVCPWNQKIIAVAPAANLPDKVQQFLQDLDPAHILNENEFKQKFTFSSISRVKRSGFYRNFSVVLGNKKDPASILFLMQLLRDSDPLIRQHAAWALGSFHFESVCSYLTEALKIEKDQKVIQEINQALS
jgi:epoxyqueuosine reductase